MIRTTQKPQDDLMHKVQCQPGVFIRGRDLSTCKGDARKHKFLAEHNAKMFNHCNPRADQIRRVAAKQTKAKVPATQLPAGNPAKVTG